MLPVDWPHSVTEEPDLYAHQVLKSYETHLASLPPTDDAEDEPISSRRVRRCVKGVDGLGDGLAENGKERLQNMTIICGSAQSYEGEDDGEREGNGTESVMVFPDYKVSRKRRASE